MKDASSTAINGREFAGKQLRWFDTLISRVQLHNPDAASYIRNYSTLRPIPLAEINAVTNKGEFLQNDGY